MMIVRSALASSLAQLSLVICAALPAVMAAGASGATAPRPHVVAVNIVEYGPPAGHG